MNGYQNGAYTFAIPFTGISRTLAWGGFRSATEPGVWQTFVAMAAIYFLFMLIGAFGYRVPRRLVPGRVDVTRPTTIA